MQVLFGWLFPFISTYVYFKYTSTGLKSPLDSVVYSGNINGDGGDANCITLEDNANGADLEHEPCESYFKSICEGPKVTQGK